MKTKTSVFPVCEGENCGKLLNDPGMGVVVRGSITRAGLQEPAALFLIGSAGKANEPTAWCWDCFRKMLFMPVEKPAERPVEVRRPEYRETYEEPYQRPGHGPTGPLPPPELPELPADEPHYVRVARSLCG